jgi:hypothetical protein
MVRNPCTEGLFQDFFGISENGHFKNVQNPFSFLLFGKKLLLKNTTLKIYQIF